MKTPLPFQCRIRYVLAGLCLLFAQNPFLVADQAAVYQQRIVAPSTMQQPLTAAVEDLRSSLTRITGLEFKIEAEASPTPETPAEGIVLRRSDVPGVPAEGVRLLDQSSRESYVLWPEENRLWLISASDRGLSHAVSDYLEQLGCRWYFPAEKWTFIPQLQDIRLSMPKQGRPAFKSRLFFGTGGFGGSLPLDPQRQIQARWEDWERRNRFGGEFRVSGHSGEAFNLKHRAELEAHPEWRAMIDGQRVPWSLEAKFCVGNPDVVALYVKDRLEEFRQQKKQDPNGPWSWAVSVDPADSGGHCTAPESLAIGSVSDRVFFVANEVARSLRKEVPDGSVSLFAYSEHAAVPSIPLEPNVYVTVIPYAFQRTGLSPDELLDAWSRKVSRMGVYDYWSIPDWTHDLPDFDPFHFGPQRLRDWERRGVDSFLCESTYSSGAMGPAWWIASRLTWDTSLDVDVLFEEFLEDCFGPAKESMRRMLLRWSQGFCLTSHELALSYRDLDEAFEKGGGDAGITSRLADYGRYLEYLRLRFNYIQTELSPSAERGLAAEQLMVHLWSIYDSSMIHAFRLGQLLARDEINGRRPQLAEKYDWMNPQAPAWTEIHPLTDEAVRALVRAGTKELSPQPFVYRRFSGPLQRISQKPVTSAPDSFSPEFYLNDSLELLIQVETPDTASTLRVGTERPVRLTVTSPQGKMIDVQTVETGGDWQQKWSEAPLRFPTSGMYRIAIDCPKRMYRIAVPSQLPVSIRNWTNSQGTPTPRLYFYVPDQTEHVAMYTDYIDAGLPNFYDPAGNKVQPIEVDQGHLIVIPAPAQYRGKIWSLDQAKLAVGPLRVLNFPNSFAFSEETLLVPADSLPPH